MLMSCASIMSAQDSARIIVHADTLDARELVGRADDTYLLDIIGRQSQSLAATQDSILQDSLKREKERYYSALTLPQLYQQPQLLHLEALDFEYKYENHNENEDELPQEYWNGYAAKWDAPYSATTEARRYLTAHHADLYTGIAKPFEPIETTTVLADKSLYELEIPQRSLIKDTEEEFYERTKALRNRHNPWYKELNTLLQFTQNYVSPNWYEGGNSALAMYARAKGYIKYDAKKRLTWETTGEWNAGFTTVKGDTLRKVSVSEDLFRIYSKLGVKIVPKLYGSMSLEFRTPLMPTYKPNTKTLKTGPFTPIRLNIAMGLDYKPINDISIVFSPAAYKLVYARDTENSPYTTYGIEEGEDKVSEFGSSVRVEWKWKPLREIALQSEFYFYTNYKGIEIDLQVNCDFIVNRFITARVSLHPRYDYAAIAEGDEKAKMQFKELISIGFAHKFY